MKILHISDIHGLHHHLDHLPSVDILVHSGDITVNGTEGEVLDYMDWS